MKSNVIPKEEADKIKIEHFFENLNEKEIPDLVDKLLNFQERLSNEDHLRIHQILEQYFLRRDEKIELKKKFKEFFVEEVEKEKRIKPSQKFIDFLVSKTISGETSRKKSAIIVNEENIKAVNLNEVWEKEESYPKVIRNSSGEIIGIEVQCKCGEVIHIDVEFE